MSINTTAAFRSTDALFGCESLDKHKQGDRRLWKGRTLTACEFLKYSRDACVRYHSTHNDGHSNWMFLDRWETLEPAQ